MIVFNGILSLVLVGLVGAFFGFQLAIYWTAQMIVDGRMKKYIEQGERKEESDG